MTMLGFDTGSAQSEAATANQEIKQTSLIVPSVGVEVGAYLLHKGFSIILEDS
jgi:hypothetical protein